jgi:hypothetical protein
VLNIGQRQVHAPEVIQHQDWEGIRLIVNGICDAAQSAFGGLDPTVGV